MSLFDSIFDKSVVIKVKYENNNETIVRKLLIDKNITLDKFHEKVTIYLSFLMKSKYITYMRCIFYS